MALITTALIGKILLGALFAGAAVAIVYLAIRLTVSFLRTYKKRHSNKIFLGKMSSLIDSLPDKDKNTVSWEDLMKCEDETLVAEFDPTTNNVEQATVTENGRDQNIENVLKQHEKAGYIIIE